jgi:Rad3-related DNA helicase
MIFFIHSVSPYHGRGLNSTRNLFFTVSVSKPSLRVAVYASLEDKGASPDGELEKGSTTIPSGLDKKFAWSPWPEGARNPIKDRKLQEQLNQLTVLDAPTGSGKTYATLHEALTLALAG